MRDIVLKQIGTIHTPYDYRAPYQPVEDETGECYLELDESVLEGLKDLESFSYVYVMFYCHVTEPDAPLVIKPRWAEGKEVGVFASRSPERPNPIGLSVVKIKSIEANKVYISGIDAFDGTPLLDIKPYIRDLDIKTDADNGWVDDLDDTGHLALHIKGIPHDY